MYISFKRKIGIIGIGSLSTLFILLMIETFFAQILTDFLIGHISDNTMLLVIMLGLFFITLIISVVIGYYIVGDIQLKSVRNASLLSLFCLLLFLFILTNSSLFYYYPEVYKNIYGFQILLVFPQVLVYFAIYVLGTVFNLFIIEIVVYYVFYVFFLEKFYVVRYYE